MTGWTRVPPLEWYGRVEVVGRCLYRTIYSPFVSFPTYLVEGGSTWWREGVPGGLVDIV